MMSEIWVVFLLLIFLGSVFFIIPLIHSSRKTNSPLIDVPDQSVIQENIRLFREQLADLEQQKNNQRISQDEFAGLKLELERNLLQASQALVGTTSTKKSKSSTLIFILVFVLFAASVFGLYQHLGANDDLRIVQAYNQKQQSDYQSMLDGKPLDTTQANSLIPMLEARLQETPDNLHYWFLLARLASEQNDYAKAASAYEEVLKVDSTSGMVKAELAQAIFLRDKNQISDRVGQLAQEALDQDPNNATALGLTGIYQFSKKQYLDAIKTWQKAVNLLGANSESGIGLSSGINRAKEFYLAQGGSQEVLDKLFVSRKITLQVSLGADVTAKPDQLVYVYARAWQGAKMPLAINRVQVSQLPLTVTLDESMAMSPQFTLASASQIELVARISEDGTATAKPGDWQVSQGPIDINQLPESINLVIEKRME
jgi:cytochrome c-type biogenesis protein CcmH